MQPRGATPQALQTNTSEILLASVSPSEILEPGTGQTRVALKVVYGASEGQHVHQGRSRCRQALESPGPPSQPHDSTGSPCPSGWSGPRSSATLHLPCWATLDRSLSLLGHHVPGKQRPAAPKEHWADESVLLLFGHAQRCSGIPPGGVQEGFWGVRDRTRVGGVQGQRGPSCAAYSAPWMWFFTTEPRGPLADTADVRPWASRWESSVHPGSWWQLAPGGPGGGAPAECPRRPGHRFLRK